MVVKTTVTIDRAKARLLEKRLTSIRKGVPRAINQATRRSVRAVRVVVVKAVREDLNVPQNKLFGRGRSRRRPIKEQLVFDGNLAKGGRVSVSGGVEPDGAERVGSLRRDRIPLGRFAARQHFRKTRSGGRRPSRVSYKIRRGGGRQSIRDAFVMRFKSGYQGVFRRVGKGRAGVIELFGPSVAHVALNRPRVRALLNRGAGDLYEKNLESSVAFLLTRGRTTRSRSGA